MHPISKVASAVACAAAVLAPAVAAAGIAQVVQVPEPGTLGMFAAGVGAAIIAVRLWRR